jgi:hypothetical protein
VAPGAFEARQMRHKKMMKIYVLYENDLSTTIHHESIKGISQSWTVHRSQAVGQEQRNWYTDMVDGKARVDR